MFFERDVVGLQCSLLCVPSGYLTLVLVVPDFDISFV